MLLSILLVLLGILWNLSKGLNLARESRKAAAIVEGKKIEAEQEKDKGDNTILAKVLDIFATFDGTLKQYTETARQQTAAIQSGFGTTPAAVAAEILPPMKALSATLDLVADRNYKATNELGAALIGQIGGLPDQFAAKLPEALRGELRPMLDMLATVKEAAIAGQAKSETAAKVAEENKAVSNAILQIVERSEKQFFAALSTLAASSTVKFTPAEVAEIEAQAAATNPPALPTGSTDPKPPISSKPSTASTNGSHNPPKLS